MAYAILGLQPRDQAAMLVDKATDLLQKYHNTLCSSIVFNFSWDLQSPQEKLLTKMLGRTTKTIMVFLKKADTFFPAEFAYKRVKYPAKRIAYVPVNQHGRRDVICRPTVPKKSKTIDIIMPRITGFYSIKHFHSSLCTIFLREGVVVVFVIIAPCNLYHAE